MSSEWTRAGMALKPAQLRDARRFAVQLVYQMEASQQTFLTDSILQAFFGQNEVDSDLRPIIQIAVQALIDKRDDVDAQIEACSSNWKLSRIAKVDLAILRICTAELMTRSEVPKDVIISEGVELGKQFGSTASGGFINGVLDSVAKSQKVVGKSKT
ncbi:MAG: transcription antitermination factor NusB [Silvanigrellaceae bacterium]